MRVLWFSTNSSGYKFDDRSESKTYGSWTSSLQSELIQCKDIVLGVCFCAEAQPDKVEQDGVIYYPVPNHRKTFLNKLIDAIDYKNVQRDEITWLYYIEKFRKVIEDFKPDVIHVFGSELYMGLASFATNIPLVLHIQGILNPCNDVYFPPGCSLSNYVLLDYNPFHIWKRYYNYVWWLRSCYRERMVIKQTRHFIGRTDWDKRVTFVLNPEATYHFGEEIMRPHFYMAGKRVQPKEMIINTVISFPYYKGFDLVLKTASLLKNNLHCKFVWNVYGNVDPKFAEKQVGLDHNNLGIVLHGVVTAETLCESHRNSTVYVHSSYIENGCNAIIEAQMCSCPVIANYVGGLSTTIKHGETGFLVPANDPYQTAYLINYLHTHREMNKEIGEKASKDAFNRHDKGVIVSELIKTYMSVMGI